MRWLSLTWPRMCGSPRIWLSSGRGHGEKVLQGLIAEAAKAFPVEACFPLVVRIVARQRNQNIGNRVGGALRVKVGGHHLDAFAGR